MKTQLLFTLPPPPSLSFIQMILSGVKHSNLPVGVGAAICSNQLFLLSISPPLKDSLAKKQNGWL